MADGGGYCLVVLVDARVWKGRSAFGYYGRGIVTTPLDCSAGINLPPLDEPESPLANAGTAPWQRCAYFHNNIYSR